VRIPLLSSRSFLLIVRTCRIFTARAVAQDPRSSQHLARFVLGNGLPSSPTYRLHRTLVGDRQLVLQTVSRRSEPSSRTALMGEQPNPWEVLPPQDATSPSTRDPKVTKPDFRPCSASRPHSQAPLCLCTLRLISNQPEGTFGRLRYVLGKCVRLACGILYRISSRRNGLIISLTRS
jgi:hypothetical protein